MVAGGFSIVSGSAEHRLELTALARKIRQPLAAPEPALEPCIASLEFARRALVWQPDGGSHSKKELAFPFVRH